MEKLRIMARLGDIHFLPTSDKVVPTVFFLGNKIVVNRYGVVFGDILVLLDGIGKF